MAVVGGVGNDFEQAWTGAVVLHEPGDAAVQVLAAMGCSIFHAMLVAAATGMGHVSGGNHLVTSWRSLKSWQLREDASTAVVEQQDAQVAPQIAIPQRILIIEEAQVACHAQHTLIGHRGTTGSSRSRTLDAVHSTITADVLSRKQIGQANGLAVSEM